MKFLLNKLKGYSPLYLIRLEVEAWCFMLFSPFPGTLGFLSRWFLGKVFFKRSHGFQWIQPSIVFVHTDRISVGTNVGINSNCYINGVGEIDIGDYVLIGNNVTISSGKHPIDNQSPSIFSRPTIPMKISIESGVWIGSGAVILPGITLGEGSVVGANSVVTKNTEPYSINVGIPAKLIRYR